MTRARISYAGLLAAALAFYAFYNGYFSFYVLLAVLALPPFSLLLSLPGMCRARLHWSLPEAVQQRGAAEAVVTARAQGLFGQLRVELTAVSMPENVRILHQTLRLAGGSAPARLSLPTEHAGGIACTVRRARVLDLSGLFAMSLMTPPSAALVVLPEPAAPVPLPVFPWQSGVRLRPRPGGGLAEEYEIRDYRPGDPMRSIHWKLSSKLDTPLVREPLEPVPEPCALYLRLDGSPDARDRVLSRLLWLLEAFSEQSLPVTVVRTDGGRPLAFLFRPEDTPMCLFSALLGLTEASVTPVPIGGWAYHIEAGGEPT